MAKKITVAKKFTFTHPDGHQQHFHVGVHKDVPDEVAGHWYTKAHLDSGDAEESGEGDKKPGAKKADGAKKDAGEGDKK